MLVVLAHVGEKPLLFLGELEVAAGGVNIHVAVAVVDAVLPLGAVDALARHARDHDDGRVGIVARVLKELLAVAGLVGDRRFVEAAELGGMAVEGTAALVGATALEAAVHVGELGVVLDAGAGEGIEEAGRVAGRLSRARAARDPLGGRPAEDVHALGRRRQRQRLVLVAHEDDSLALDLLREGAALVHGGFELLTGDVHVTASQISLDGVAEEGDRHVDRHERGEKNGGESPAKNVQHPAETRSPSLFPVAHATPVPPIVQTMIPRMGGNLLFQVLLARRGGTLTGGSGRAGRRPIHSHSEGMEYTPVPHSIAFSESLRRQGHVRGLVVYNDGASGLSPHTTPRLQSRRRVLMKPRPHSR